jgi:DNA-binding PadR family transcriptional regulator
VGGGFRADAWTEKWTEWWRGPSPRVERGLVRYLILDAIADQPRHGYEIIQAIGDKSGGAYRPSPGVVYPTLQLLDELGHARTVMRDDRKVYEITGDGRRDLGTHAEEVAEFYGGHSEDSWGDQPAEMAHFLARVGHLVVRFKRAWRSGTIRPGTMRRIRKTLDASLAELERLIEEEEER